MDVTSAPHLIECMLDCITESMSGPIETVTRAIGDQVDAIAVSDDIGHQDRLCMSPRMYREIVKPRHRRLARAIKSGSDKPLVWHTCGCVYDILDDLIEIGVDSLNLVQTTARNMEAERLKSEYGRRLSFWSAIDTMHILNHGTPEDVRPEVMHTFAELAPGGGYILSPVHNVQPDVPVDNLLAMIDAALEYGRFPAEATAENQG
jgi:uroporphyrinogen decarboxylase